MSIEGPRLQLAHYLDGYTPDWARRHEVRPGNTTNRTHGVIWRRDSNS
jgi:lipopolysaccharide/colanic/teichoic acid biosynthesis glycosyltransferase